MNLEQFMNRLAAIPNGEENVIIISTKDYDNIETEIHKIGRYRHSGSIYRVADNCGITLMVSRAVAEGDPVVLDTAIQALDFILEKERRVNCPI